MHVLALGMGGVARVGGWKTVEVDVFEVVDGGLGDFAAFLCPGFAGQPRSVVDAHHMLDGVLDNA